jgi:hypothetical protein
MKTRIYIKTILLFVAAAHFALLPLSGQKASTSFRELFTLTDHGSLEINNRYGSIDIRNWEKNEISVEVDVTVAHSDRNTAEKQLSYINIEFSQRENDVKALTVIDQRVGQQWLRWFSAGREDTRITINYTVYAPSESDLNITHRYGDIFINEASGHTLVDLRYGNLQANSIIRDNTRPLSEINLAYSTKATITDAEWLKVNMRYSDLTVNRCRALVVSSSYSKLRVERASSVVAESRYGEFTLGHINNFVAESSYTNYTINQVSNTLDIQSRYGNVRVDSMPADFSKIRFESSYGNMRAGIDPGATYRIEASGSYGSVNINSENRVSRETRGGHFTLSGIVGAGSDPKATVDISTRYGNVDLR